MSIQTKTNLRGFISLLTALSFLIMTVSGIILFVVPQGRIASWINWRMFGLTKTQWGDMHITTSLLFALAGLWHTWLNWRALVSYFTTKARKTIALKRELAIASLITIFFTVGAVYKTAPLNYILDFNDDIKESWIKTPDDEPPIAHAELLPLSSFLQKEAIDLEPALQLLKQHQIKIIGPDQKLGEIAEQNHTSPAALYKIMNKMDQPPAAKQPLPAHRALQPAVSAKKVVPAAPAFAASERWTAELVQDRLEGRGLGRKSLAEVCAEFKLDQAAIIKKLAAKKIVMTPNQSLKQAGSKYNELPLEIMKIILVGETIN